MATYSDEEELDRQPEAEPEAEDKQAKVDEEDNEGDDAEGEDAEGEDEEDEDEDEEDEEEDEEDEDDVARPAKRRRRSRRNQLLDVEAEVDDEDEEEEEGEEELADEIHPDDLLRPEAADLDDRRHRELDRQRQLESSKDAEQLAKELDEKYRRREMQRAQGRGVAGAVPLALPTVNDPSIWAVKCRPGKEKEVILAVTRRIEERIRAGMAPRVYSVFARGTTTMQGNFYVEADSKQDMIEIVENITNVFMGQPQIAIEVKERPDLLRRRPRTPLEVGKFVRMLRPPLYKGDLAKIAEIHSNGLDCTVQLVPRINYGAGEDANAIAADNKRKRAFGRGVIDRPPQKLFNEAEAKKKDMRHLASGMGNKAFVYKNEDYQNGFLIKDVKINHISAENVNPRMEEMQFFSVTAEDGTETLDLVAVQAAQRAQQKGSSFVTGDRVEIYDGEQKGTRGVTVSVTGDIVTLRISEGELKGRITEAPVKTLRKLFAVGDHVKVISGSHYVDEVGLVTRVKGDKVTLLCDSTQQEITVFSRDLKLAADSATVGADSDYELYDLVQIDASTVGCVIKVDREILRLLDQHGNVRNMLHSQVQGVVAKNRNAVATDRDGSEIHNDDTVKEHGGEGRQGKVLHIHRGMLFVQAKDSFENGGIFAVRSTNVTTLAAKSGRQQAGPDLGKLNPAMQPGGNPTAMPPPQRMVGRDRLIGKTVGIRKGPQKGLLGIVKDTMGDNARVELHTKGKHLTIPKEFLVVKDPVTGQNMDMGGKFPNRTRGGFSGATPGRTPGGWNNGSRNGPSWGATPAGGRTPGWGGAGGRTPGWGGAGGRTPGWGGDGGKTAYGGDGSRTAYGGDGSRTAYGGDGSRTSYGGATAYGGATSYAPTPGAYAAPTPGAYGAYSAPTPGNFAAPTPGETPAVANTPGAWMDTPYGTTETPAPSGLDEEPSYS